MTITIANGTVTNTELGISRKIVGNIYVKRYRDDALFWIGYYLEGQLYAGLDKPNIYKRFSFLDLIKRYTSMDRYYSGAFTDVRGTLESISFPFWGYKEIKVNKNQSVGFTNGREFYYYSDLIPAEFLS